MSETGPKAAAIAFLCSLMLLAGCGGGGSGGSDGDGDGDGADDSGILPFDSGSGFNSSVFRIALAADGSGDIYVGGAFTAYNGTARNYIVRINNDGSVDTGFDPGTGFNNNVNTIEPATDGSGDIYVGGSFTTYNGTARNFIARLNSDGSLDVGFDPGTGFNNPVSVISAATVGGDIYVGGQFTVYRGNARSFIARVNSDGSDDGGFDPGAGFDSSVSTIVPTIDGSGDIYVGGAFKNYRAVARAHIVRLNPNASIEGSFDVGSGFSNNVLSIALANDGSGDVFAGGKFATYRGNTRNRLVRIKDDGSNDGNFDPGMNYSRGADEINVIVPATDGSGDLYVGGVFGSRQPYIGRVESDGSQDTGFRRTGNDPNDEVFTIALATDSRRGIYVGGSFVASTFFNTTKNRIVRLDATGAQN